MPPTPKTEADLRAWEGKKGFIGVISGHGIFRKCADCSQPTKGVAEIHCGKHGGKRQVLRGCQVEGCRNVAKKIKQCYGCWVADDPAARGCPGCHKQPKRESRPDNMCPNCVRDAAVSDKRDAGRKELAKLCAEHKIEEGPANVADAAFGTRYAVLNCKDNHKPWEVVRIGDKWKLACAEPGCRQMVQRAPGTPNTHCRGHGGGSRCQGPPGAEACPLNNSIQVTERDSQVRYLKDGVQYCCGCFCAAFKDHELTKNAKAYMHAKEQEVREFLERRFAAAHPQLKWVMDRCVNGTRRRPDHRPLLHLLGINSHDLVLETDENSHWFYLCADERDKETDIHFWLNGKTKPLFFVRFNPDAYDDPVTGGRVPSCWGKGPFGLPRIKQSKDAEWAARLEKLAQVVEAYLVDHTDTWVAWDEADRPKPELHAIELFYDDVKVKKNAATQAFDAIKAAAKTKKRKATTAAVQ